MHLYQVRPRKDKRGVDLISDVCHSVRCGIPRLDAVDYANSAVLANARARALRRCVMRQIVVMIPLNSGRNLAW